MRIKSLASVAANEIELEEINLLLFKPFGLDCRLYINDGSFIEFKYLESEEDMTLDDFYYECGYVMPANIINNKQVLEKLEAAYKHLLLNTMRFSEEIRYADIAPAAILTRAVLKDCPRALDNEFKHLIINKAFDLGFRKEVINEAIMLYGN